MRQEVLNKPHMGNRSLGYALKRRNDRFVVEPIGGIENPAYEPDLGGDIATTSEFARKCERRYAVLARLRVSYS